ncbi:Hypothetical protein LUCI_4578 [Lucifera butyrica]|uniref:Uncharacterized protein n=1 Tax=Lucifera butyrica TaxID=1351585 RepID=A0A498RJT2_9FIRM|nr:hypothetical protein [Lucifera butyrica]VBB09288.1 Hypothetical protein LUCI_4578 [Lucifera butyrica]
MRKSIFTIFMTSLLILAAAAPCFASVEPASTANMLNEKPVVLDRQYPELGFATHSWLTGTDKDLVAHTQTIELNTGRVIAQIDNPCDYPARYGGQTGQKEPR